MKFGGSSLADAERFAGVRTIVRRASEEEEIAVVLSAMKGVTNQLQEAASAAEAGDPRYKTIIDELDRRHRDTIDALEIDESSTGIRETVAAFTDELRNVLHGVELVKECSPRIMDFVLSFGERLSCSLAAADLTSRGVAASMVDARKIIVTNDAHGNAAVDFPTSYQRTAHALHQDGAAAQEGHPVPVITGFIASSADGVTTTLGRNGSDFTASLVAAAVNADVIEIWTDVDGVFSADPRTVSDAFVVDRISVQEAMELSYFGAEVIHPYTMIPAVEKQIPLRIRNSLNPEAMGTWITHEPAESGRLITGIASIQNVALINVEGGGMVGIPGMASRVFGALADAGVNIIMISQASSEHSICIVCRDAEAKAALESLKAELREELETKKIQEFQLMTDLEIVAAIGEKMRGTPGISGKLFSALGEEGVNVLAIAQGSSETNISFVIQREERAEALNCIHRAFFRGEGAAAR
jgi:aspartokinase/homoserine dehydrogenase 1